MPTTPPDSPAAHFASMTFWQTLLAFVAGVVALGGTLAAAIVRALRPATDLKVLESLQRNEDKVAKWIASPTMFGPKIQEIDETIATVHENAGKLKMVEDAIAKLDDLPSQVGRLADAVNGFKDSAQNIVAELANQRREFTAGMAKHGESIGELRGAVNQWTGPERRVGRRREDDR